MLLAARAGQRLPRVLGFVYVYPFRGWPLLDGPALAGAVVTVENKERKLTATSRPDGSFLLNDAPPGIYKLTAQLPPFVDDDRYAFLQVPEHGCGSADVPLRTTSVIRGRVLNSRGRPMAGIPVTASVAGGPEDRVPSIDVKASANGVFSIPGVPDADVYLSAGPSAPSTDMPYRRMYYPHSLSFDTALPLHLKPGDTRIGITIRLGPPLRARSLKVRVLSAAGQPAGGPSRHPLFESNVDPTLTLST